MSGNKQKERRRKTKNQNQKPHQLPQELLVEQTIQKQYGLELDSRTQPKQHTISQTK